MTHAIYLCGRTPFDGPTINERASGLRRAPSKIALRTSSHEDAGTVDWELGFPDGAVGVAHSRVTETARGTCIYSFVLHAPPVPLEQLEGALDAQRATLREELAQLKRLLEAQ